MDNERKDEAQSRENQPQQPDSTEPSPETRPESEESAAEQNAPGEPTVEPAQPQPGQPASAGPEANQPEPGQIPPPLQHNPADVSSDSRNLGLLCHLLGLFTSFIGPLVIWLIKKDEDKYVDHHGREALNFQITVLIGGIVSGILSFFCIGIILGLVVAIADIVYCILATVAASEGKLYKYPVSIRLVQ